MGLGIVLKAASIDIFFPLTITLFLGNSLVKIQNKVILHSILQTNLFLGMELITSTLLLKYYCLSLSHYIKLLKLDTVCQIVHYLPIFYDLYK